MGQAIFESVFNIVYIVIGILIGSSILRKAKSKSLRILGYMVLVLVFGDMFHLLPRIYSYWFEFSRQLEIALGYGKMITSITMTVFYIMLYMYWRKRYSVLGKKAISILIVVLSVSRFILCLHPNNQWQVLHGSYEWGIYRNIPFVLIGIIIIYLYYTTKDLLENDPLRSIWLAVLLSFLFYLPVILFVAYVPIIGMLMIPKTVAYVWIMFMCYRTVQEE